MTGGTNSENQSVARRPPRKRAFPESEVMFVSVTAEPKIEGTDIYGELMAEAIKRCQLVHRIINGKLVINQQFGIEICYLQFRSICEIIALGCLSAHGDLAMVREQRLLNTYQADKIIRRLADINPSFYPISFKGTMRMGSPVETHEDETYLTKEDLTKLYNLSGNFLHIGDFKQLSNDNRPIYSIAHVKMWHDKITTLLNNHIVMTINPDYVIFNQVSGYGKGRAPLQVTGIAKIRIHD